MNRGGRGHREASRGGGGATGWRDTDLPRWVAESLGRVTPSARVPGALQALDDAASAFAGGRFEAAVRHARQAKELAPRDATVREVLGLAAYRMGDWLTALRELRTYRRLAGDPIHLPVEMDALRAMGRNADVEKVWEQLTRLEIEPAAHKEGRVVYASFLLDEGRVAEARRVLGPGSLSDDPYPEDLRLWYVTARAAALEGDLLEAQRLRDAILGIDPSIPGMDELERTISSQGRGPTE